MSSDLTFYATERATPIPGLALRIPQRKGGFKYLRITHVFREELYGMWISTAEQARYAGRPFLLPWKRYANLATKKDACLGRLSLPTALTRPLDKLEKLELEGQWQVIAPLVELFKDRRNLRRQNFSALVRDQAALLDKHFNSVLRLLIRFFYFGGDRRGLLTLPPGTPPETNGYELPGMPKRRGRKSARLEAEYGPNEFVVSEEDIADMVAALEAGLRGGVTYLNDVYENHYLKVRFSKRHPETYGRLLRDEIPPPVTERQFRYYTGKAESCISRDLLENKKGARRTAGHAAALRAFGPGSMYEIDATGGRVVVVTAGPDPVELGLPWIYLVIDRWSRYVVAVYITLRSPSFEEVRHALLAMLTTRDRYRLIGCNVTDQEWPRGCAPAGLCCDRGAEFLSHAFEETVAERLLIPFDVLPPLTPDGKALVERAIRTLKRRLSAAAKKAGGYGDRPTSSPKASKEFRMARRVAVHSLAEIYRVLVEIIRDYNNRPHKTLIGYPELAAHGIKPVPRDAFLFGSRHISGLDTGTMSDEDFCVLLLDEDTAEGIDHCVRYHGELYDPCNLLARKIAGCWRKKAVSLHVRVDELGRELRVWAKQDWALFKLKPGIAAQAGTYTPEEQARLREISGGAASVCRHKSLVRRLRTNGLESTPSRRKAPPRRPERLEKIELRARDTEEIKGCFNGMARNAPVASAKDTGRDEYKARAEAIDRAVLEDQMSEIRRHRRLK